MAKCSEPACSGAFWVRAITAIRIRSARRLAASAILMAAFFMGALATESPKLLVHVESNQGSVKVAPAADNAEDNNPHLPCGTIYITGGDLTGSSGSYTIASWDPSGSQNEVWKGSWTFSGDHSQSTIANFDATELVEAAELAGATQAHEGFHFKLDVEDSSGDKYKVFWVNCDPADPTPTPTPTPHATSTPTPDCEGSDECSSASPSPSPSPTPTPTPTPIPTPTGEPTPTPTPQNTPSPTPPTSSATPTPWPTGGALGTTATPTPTPHGGVLGASAPGTGSDLVFYLMAGAILVALGVALIVSARREAN